MFVYLEGTNRKTGAKSGLFHRRGQVGDGDDIEGFTRQMAASGLRVAVSETDLGEKVPQEIIAKSAKIQEVTVRKAKGA